MSYIVETKYKEVSASTVDSTGGITPANGATIGIVCFRANGADPSAYVVLSWDWGGASEKVFASTKGDIHEDFDCSLTEYQLTGDGSKALKIVIVNDNTSTSPIIGGSVEVVEL